MSMVSDSDARGADWQLAQTFAFHDQSVRYDITGRGPPLVLVHGTPWSSFSWRHLIPRLRGRWTVHYYDMPGYGQSDKSDTQDVSLGIQNRVLCALLDHWGLERPNVVAHDFGGATALRALLLDHRSYAKLFLFDVVALAPWGSPFFLHVKRHEEAFQGLPDYIHEAVVTAYVRGAMHNPMTAETLAGVLSPWTGDTGRKAFYRQIALADQRYTDEIEPLYASITCPTFIAWGVHDSWIPLATGRRLHDRIPHSGFATVESAGHLVQEERPAALLDLIEAFLD